MDRLWKYRTCTMERISIFIRSNLSTRSVLLWGSCTKFMWLLSLLSPAPGLRGSARGLCQVSSAVWAEGLSRHHGHPGSAAHTERRHPSVLQPQCDSMKLFLNKGNKLMVTSIFLPGLYQVQWNLCPPSPTLSTASEIRRRCGHWLPSWRAGTLRISPYLHFIVAFK